MAKKAKLTEKEKTIEQLQADCHEYSSKLFELRNQHRLNRKVEKAHLLRTYRRDIARALTAINMKKKENKVK